MFMFIINSSIHQIHVRCSLSLSRGVLSITHTTFNEMAFGRKIPNSEKNPLTHSSWKAVRRALITSSES